MTFRESLVAVSFSSSVDVEFIPWDRDLYSIPTDLRVHLEECLGEDASPAVLEQHMPRIKQVIHRLLIGLKAKQEPYKIAMAGKRKAAR